MSEGTLRARAWYQRSLRTGFNIFADYFETLCTYLSDTGRFRSFYRTVDLHIFFRGELSDFPSMQVPFLAAPFSPSTKFVEPWVLHFLPSLDPSLVGLGGLAARVSGAKLKSSKRPTWIHSGRGDGGGQFQDKTPVLDGSSDVDGHTGAGYR